MRDREAATFSDTLDKLRIVELKRFCFAPRSARTSLTVFRAASIPSIASCEVDALPILKVSVPNPFAPILVAIATEIVWLASAPT